MTESELLTTLKTLKHIKKLAKFTEVDSVGMELTVVIDLCEMIKSTFEGAKN